ncbi:hypothetical protein PIB30_042653 [Stylosanthes scabra]|uniref:USP domain-containing protein n=1 Tax=Stylosanthes scabra TaxID=79078 RepID=A0ABU6RFX4_9FABA|nr:hypothetical protein [Stylosanthes scabra]
MTDNQYEKSELLNHLSLETENVQTLKGALDSFFAIEILEGKCGQCSHPRERQYFLTQTPQIAILHLKRFKVDPGRNCYTKIDRNISFGLELDLEDYYMPDLENKEDQINLKYELYAMVVHLGRELHSGHYYCFVRTYDNKWHKLNDAEVSLEEEEEALNQQCYILFYARKPVDAKPEKENAQEK